LIHVCPAVVCEPTSFEVQQVKANFEPPEVVNVQCLSAMMIRKALEIRTELCFKQDLSACKTSRTLALRLG
jgi:hypothetical protein